KGSLFEKRVLEELRKMNLFVRRTKKVGKEEIKELEGTLSRYNKNEALGIFVVSRRNGYSKKALSYMRGSPYKLLLTNLQDLRYDLANFSFEKVVNTSKNKKSEME
ncbi:15823_t:CDS:2, partial [Acaulospora morrowiae]